MYAASTCMMQASWVFLVGENDIEDLRTVDVATCASCMRVRDTYVDTLTSSWVFGLML